MKHNLITIEKEAYFSENKILVMECPVCGKIVASASEIDLLPEFSTCEGTEDNG